MEKNKEIREDVDIVVDEKQEMYGERPVEMCDGKKAIKMNDFEKEESTDGYMKYKSEVNATKLSLREAELKLERKINTSSAKLYLKNEKHKLSLMQNLVDEYNSYQGEGVETTVIPDEFYDKYKVNKDLFDIEIEKENMKFTQITIEKTEYALEIGQPEDKSRSDVRELQKALKQQEGNMRIYKKRMETGFMLI